MKKLLPLTLGLAALLLGGCNLLQQTGVAIPGTSKTYTVDSLKALIELGIPLKCSYSINNTEYQGYVKGKQWRGKVTTPDTETGEIKTGEIILKDKCMWTWEEGKNTGVRMCFDEDMWDQPEPSPGQATTTMDMEYRCSAAVIDDSLFTPPADINFMDPFSNPGNFGQ
jgi:hypothetical protein